MRMFVAGLSAVLLLAAPAVAGEAHTLLDTDKTLIGGPITYPDGKPRITAVSVTMAPGESNGWHLHPVPTLGRVLTGELTVYYEGGEKRLVKAGDTIVEAQNVIHMGRNEGTEPVELLVFYAGGVGVPNTIMKPDYKAAD